MKRIDDAMAAFEGSMKRGYVRVLAYCMRHRFLLIMLLVLLLAFSVIPVDFVRKPDGTESTTSFLHALAQKIIVASCAKVYRAPAARAAAPAAAAQAAPPVSALGSSSALDHTIIGLGASTGGTEATLEVLKRLPADIPGMVIVQHMPPDLPVCMPSG